MEAYMIWIWIAVFVATLIIEAVTNELVSIWFTVGSIGPMICCWFAPIWVQFLVFVILSGIALFVTRPILKRYFKKNAEPTNIDGFIGKKFKLIKEITEFEPGLVKINGIEYTAKVDKYTADILKDTVVEITALDGNKVIVKEIEEENK